jgi:hypothetical protein
MNKFVAGLLAAALVGVMGHGAFASSLSPNDTKLGRVKAAALKAGLSVSADLGDDAPSTTHVIARFQNNQPLMLGRDGLWAPWNGDLSKLDDAGATVADKTITFRIFDKLPDALFYPVSFTVVYRTDAGLKSGTITVDGP